MRNTSMRKSRTASAAALCASTILIAACGSSTSPGSGPGGANGAAQAAATSPVSYSDLDALVTAAKAEGSINVFNSPDYPFLVSGFEKEYPWAKVTTFQAESGPLVAKWQAESNAGVHNADFLIMHANSVEQFAKAGQLAPVEVPNDAKVIEALRDSQHYSHPVTELPVVFVYNTALTDTAPKTIEALGDAEWKDKLIIDSPELGADGGYALAAQRERLGDEAWEKLLENIAGNGPQITDTASSSFAAVTRGDRPMCLCDYQDFKSAPPGTPLGVEYYDQDTGGIVTKAQSAVIPSTAPHPAMAALFLNYALSPTGGQVGFVESGRIPTVPDVAGAEEVALPEGIKVVPLFNETGLLDYMKNTEEYNAMYKKYFR